MSELSTGPMPPRVVAVLPYIVFAAGVLMTAYLLSFTRPGFFFSGDGGLKLMVVKQFIQGHWSVQLDPEAPSWVKALWDEGMFPVKSPFLTRTDVDRVVAFPFWFQVLTAPLYFAFGYYGLYIIPIVSLWLLWYRFDYICRLLGASVATRSLCLVMLVFATPITLYGAIYWEHTLACLLVMLGLEAAVRMRTGRLTSRAALLLGTLSGVSVCFRPESIWAVIPLLGAPVIAGVSAPRSDVENARTKPYLILSLATCSGVLIFFLVNLQVYGDWLGAHAHQVVGTDFAERVPIIRRHMSGLMQMLTEAFPSLYVILLGLPLLLVSSARRFGMFLVAIATIFFLGVSYMVPNTGGLQLGPRYLLPMIPVLIVIVAMEFQGLSQIKAPVLRGIIGFVFFAAVLLSLWSGVAVNSRQGSGFLRGIYSRDYEETLESARSSNATTLLLTHHFLSMKFADLMDPKHFIVLNKPKQALRFVEGLRESQTSEFLYITVSPSSPYANFVIYRRPPERFFVPAAMSRLDATVEFRLLNRNSEFDVYEGHVRFQ